MQRSSLILLWGNRLASQEGWSAKLLGAYLAPRTGHASHVLAKRGLFGKPEAFSLEGAQAKEDGTPFLAPGATSAPARGSVRLTDRTPVSIAGGHGNLLGLILDRKAMSPRYILVRYQGDVRAIRQDLAQNLTSGSPSLV